MDRASVVELAGRLADAAGDAADAAALGSGLADARRLRAWLDGIDVALARRLAELEPIPEAAVAAAARVSERAAARVLERAGVAGQVPVFGGALAAGRVSGHHVDAFGRGLRDLDADQRPALLGRAAALLPAAEELSADRFERVVRAEVRRIQTDHGVAQLERQRRATRLRTWVDGEGLWCLSGRFDPATGVQISGRIANAVATLFAGQAPAGCPSDPGEKQDFLRAHALVALLDGSGARGGQSELVVVVDTTATAADGGPVVDWGLPVEIPWPVLADLEGRSSVHAVVVRNGVVLHAPGQLVLGRTTRVANRAQRRALRALYPTCAIPGCTVRFDVCKIHHLQWWRHGGRTDLDNLLPICERHHHCVHDLGWQVTLGPDRSLTVRPPHGAVLATGPPGRRAA